MEETEREAQQYSADSPRRRIGAAPGHGTEIQVVEPNSPARPEVNRADKDEDLRLLRRAGGGDGKAFHRLLDRHADRLFRLAWSLMGNEADAEDVVQETFAGAYRGIKGFEGRSSVGTWLTRILVTQAAKFRRDRKRPMARMDSVGPRAAGGSGPEAVEAKIDLQAALAQLSAEHQQILVLREFEQMSYDEIAEALDVPRGTVESRLHRAREELRQRLKAYGVASC